VGQPAHLSVESNRYRVIPSAEAKLDCARMYLSELSELLSRWSKACHLVVRANRIEKFIVGIFPLFYRMEFSVFLFTNDDEIRQAIVFFISVLVVDEFVSAQAAAYGGFYDGAMFKYPTAISYGGSVSGCHVGKSSTLRRGM